MPSRSSLSVVLVDPSLFTAPYDAGLTEGLLAAGVLPVWATRPTRKGDRQPIPAPCVDPFFYRRSDQFTGLPGGLRTLVKGLAHLMGLVVLVLKVIKNRPDIVHVQWLIIPPLDIIALRIIQAFSPVALTVHDTVPYNGERMSLFQNMGFDLPIKLVDKVIVHTKRGRENLIARGIAADKIIIVPHGPLKLDVPMPQTTKDKNHRWTFVLFGEIKPYKGVDILIEAVAALSPEVRAGAKFVIAGRPRMDIQPLQQRIDELSLNDSMEIRPQRLSEGEMAVLFDEADTFIFPYRNIDASGVYYLVKPLRKWLIASRVGVFDEDVKVPAQGELVPVEDVAALSLALQHAVERRPVPEPMVASESWLGIGQQTLAIYQGLARAHAA